MAKYKVEDIRNIALVGHGAAGKTSLADALLFAAKAVSRRGSPDEGTSVSDYDEEEHKRHFSIDTSILHLEWKGKRFHLLDAPGYPDFVGAALEALNAVENAVIVVSAPSGVEGREGGADEVGVAGGVEQVDVLALIFQVQHTGVDGEVAFLLLFVPIGDAGAIVDAALAVDRPGGEEQAVGQRGLSGRPVPHQCHRADVLDAILGHESFLESQVGEESSSP